MVVERIRAGVKALDRRMLNLKLSRSIARARQSPASLSVDISRSCNLKCRMCSLEQWYPRLSNKTMPVEVVEELAHIVPKVNSIALQCNTEPLLNRNIVDIIRQFKKVKPTLHISFVTNGMLLSRSVSSKLIESGLDEIGVSIDGATAETNDGMRLGGKLEKILRNIKDLNAEKDAKASSTPRLRIVTVSSKKNVSELVAILELAIQLRADSFTVNGVEPYDEEMANLALWGMSVNGEFRNVFAELRRIASKNGIKLSLPSLELQPYKYCVLNGCVIDSDGDVYPCGPLSYERPYYYLGDKSIHPRKSFGNVQERSLSEIWNSKKYRGFRTSLLEGHLPDYCSRCLMQNEVICPKDSPT